MSGVGPRHPPASSRFRKGQSGNPRGRPKAGARVPASAFDIVLDRTLTLTQNGKPREVTLAEALQQRTYQDAIAGSRAARREVLRMIAKREKWLAAKATSSPRPPEILSERKHPDNVNEALVLLGIAEPHPGSSSPDGTPRGIRLRPWAVQAALSRPGRRRLSAKEVAEIKRRTRDAHTLRWPAGVRNAQGD
jgi:hypothetical protein